MWGDEKYTPVGPIRLIVAKHNPKGMFKNTISIIDKEIFILGFVCVDDKSNKSWVNEEVDTHGDDVVKFLLQDHPNGLYEIVGDLSHAAWRCSYEYNEWDSDIEIENHKIQPISYDAAYWSNRDYFDDEEVPLLGVKGDYNCFSIHHYMQPLQIKQTQAEALAEMTRNYGDCRVNGEQMTEEQLDNFIHLMMLDIDSQSEKSETFKSIANNAIRIDSVVKETIDAHLYWYKNNTTEEKDECS